MTVASIPISALFSGMIAALLSLEILTSIAWILAWPLVIIWFLHRKHYNSLQILAFYFGHLYILLSFRFTPVSDIHNHVLSSSPMLIEKISISGDVVLLANPKTKRYHLKRGVYCKDSKQILVKTQAKTQVKTHKTDKAHKRQKAIFCTPPENLTSSRQNLRQKTLKALQDLLNTKSIPANAWVYATLFGDRKAMRHEELAMLRHLGILHLASASGFHLTLLLLFLKTLSWLARKPWKCLQKTLANTTPHKTSLHENLIPWLAFLLECSILLFWLYLVGFRPSALRAFACYLALRALNTQLFSDRIENASGVATQLMLCFCVFMLLSPLDVVSFASILSWSSYLVIILFLRATVLLRTTKTTDLQKPSLSKVNTWIRKASYPGFLQLCLIWLNFLLINEVSYLALLGNLLIMPLLMLCLKGYLFAGAILALLSLCTMPFYHMSLSFVQSITTILSYPLTYLFAQLTSLTQTLLQYQPLMIHSHHLSPKNTLIMECVSLCIFSVALFYICKHTTSFTNLARQKRKS